MESSNIVGCQDRDTNVGGAKMKAAPFLGVGASGAYISSLKPMGYEANQDLIDGEGTDGSQWAYFSANKNATGAETGAGTLAFSISSVSVKDLSTTGTSAGWYQIKEAPEPTSGILMLIGLGALALRRRRA